MEPQSDTTTPVKPMRRLNSPQTRAESPVAGIPLAALKAFITVAAPALTPASNGGKIQLYRVWALYSVVW